MHRKHLSALHRFLWILLICAGLAVACGDDSSTGNNNNEQTDAGPGMDADINEAPAVLEIYPLDIWAQPLPAGEATLDVTLDGQDAAHTGWPLVLVPLYDAGDYAISLSAPEHETLDVSVTWDVAAPDVAEPEPPEPEAVPPEPAEEAGEVSR